MYFTVYLLLLTPAALAATGPGLTRRLAPAAAVRALACLAAAGTLATLWALAALALAGLAHPPQGDETAFAAADPVPRCLGPIAATLLATAAVRLALTTWRRHRDGQALAGLRHAPAAGDLLVLPEERPDAFALPGHPARIVVTAGMLRALPAAERAALLAHERAHLTHRHHRYAALAQAAAAVNPLLGRLREELAFGLERWADETAAEAVGSRQLAGRALARAALATTGCVPSPPATLAYLRHRITARVGALRAPRPVSHWPHVWPAAAALGVASAAAGDLAFALVRLLNALAP
ncbi:hypothetical protein CFP65_0918 [Kitasatospora sp. MMS16-BH015]|uniref:M56 family metallopeptidase n=1 Tax=Kitasatospora sp. MMS16-BH015 TaxID=2018025 RepID=UPI000CA1B29F|nr:M56 family metallopeptidase [Kitasatospora sp. MMS16-BH015]AUG75839.1 hypothetical protein CFP65_0918 [Kitasatospora sp. MMS16-BH015]